MDPVLKAGARHLWFVTIHPFDDGNGRIARAHRRYGRWRAPNAARSASTACRRRSGRSAKRITTFWNRRRKARLRSRRGWNGSWAVWTALSAGTETALAAVFRQGPVLEDACRHVAQRPAARDPQSAAGWRLRGEADIVQVGEARQMLPGHGAPRHPTSSRTASCARTAGRPEHELFPVDPGGRRRSTPFTAPGPVLQTSWQCSTACAILHVDFGVGEFGR